MKENKRSAQTLWQLFKATFLLSAFTFGGGFCHRVADEEKICRRIKVAGRIGDAGHHRNRTVLPWSDSD